MTSPKVQCPAEAELQDVRSALDSKGGFVRRVCCRALRGQEAEQIGGTGRAVYDRGPVPKGVS